MKSQLLQASLKHISDFKKRERERWVFRRAKP
jgi:hypothetical protein